MKEIRTTIIIAPVLITGILILSCFHQSVNAEDPKFEKLFNGKSLDGWKIQGATECWHIDRSRLCCIANKRAKWIRTEEKFKYFILKFEWKISEGAQSGLFIGFDPDKTSKDELVRIPIQNQLADNLHCTGAIYGIAPVIQQPDSSPDIWHTLEVHYLESGITVLCDGEKSSHLEIKQKNFPQNIPAKGYIAFQAISDNSFNQIEFRDIKIRKIED